MKKLESYEVGGSQILNEFDCPLLEETGRYDVIPSVGVLGCVSVIHECGNSCEFTQLKNVTVERESISVRKKGFKHDDSNCMYSLNIYCMNYYSSFT